MAKQKARSFSQKIFYWQQTSYALLLSGLATAVSANNFAEFDAGFLSGNAKETIDISRFSYGNPVPPGSYLTDVFLNSEFRGRINVQFVDDPENKQTLLCNSKELLSVLDLKETAFVDNADKVRLGCTPFSLVSAANVDFDISQLRLDVDLPQAYIVQRPKGYISPAQWQNSVPTLFTRYDLSHYRYRYANEHSQQSYLGISAGFNLLDWAVRHRGSQSWNNQRRLPYQSIATYAQHDVAALRGQFTIGDFYTSGTLMESVAIRGMQLASDDRMLASSIRGYAPVIRGVANSNAKVSIYQNGNLLYEKSVPAGPFEIDDLYPTGYGGDIKVEVLEANGERKTFSIPYTASAQLIRPGYSRYQLSVGRYRYDNKLFRANIAQATWQYGLTNDVTLNLGTTIAKNYHAELMGLSFNTPIGAFATNATFSHATFKNSHSRQKGYSLYASYNTRLEPTNTNVTLAAYRYLSHGYYNVQDVLRANESAVVDESLFGLGAYPYRTKNQFQVSINQVLQDNWGSLYLVGSTSTYWNASGKQNEYQIGYGNSYKQLNYNLSFSQTKNSEGEKDNQFYLNLSLALGSSNYNYLSEVLTYNRANGYANVISLSGTLDDEHRYSYSLSLAKQRKNHNFSFSNNYQGAFVRVGASFSQDNQQNRQMSANLSGAIVAHPKGITLANDLSDNFAIIHAEGARGARIKGSIGNEIDYFGNGIVPYLDPYTINYVGLDTSKIPDRIELTATEQQVIPRANGAILVNFATKAGNVVFFELSNITEFPSIGTDVFNQEGEAVGVVSQGGRIYTRGVANQGTLHLNLGQKQCQFDYDIPAKQNNGQVLIIPVQCQVK